MLDETNSLVSCRFSGWSHRSSFLILMQEGVRTQGQERFSWPVFTAWQLFQLYGSEKLLQRDIDCWSAASRMVKWWHAERWLDLVKCKGRCASPIQ